MRVILEGPDNAGKTTLARKVTGACPHVVYRHPGGPPPTFEAERACMIEQEGWLCLSHTVVDRVTSISQRVYSPDPALDPERAAHLQKLLQVYKPLVIYCRPSTDRLMRREDFTWRDGETEEHKQKILQNQHTFIQRYDEVMTPVPHVAYDFDDPNSSVIVQRLCGAMSGRTWDIDWFRELASKRSY